VEKTEFLEVLRHYASTSVEEAESIASLRTQYPYSQLLQTLAARASKDHGFQHQQRDLQTAAVYAADRAILKDIVTSRPEEPVKLVVSKHVDADQKVAATIESADVADVVMDDLDRLSKLKETFEHLFVDYPKGMPKPKEDSKPLPEKNISESPAEFKRASEPETSERKLSPVKSKKQRIIEMAKALNSNQSTESTTPPKRRRGEREANPQDELITEIQNSKKEIVPENERQKQQIEIINEFIRVQPSISNPRDRAPSAPVDLSTIKSGEFGDNIVSETLVEILLKQGKKDKAIEVLKKLIWKYPQKKAYFASRIEELKK
jgi:hypothetical protein